MRVAAARRASSGAWCASASFVGGRRWGKQSGLGEEEACREGVCASHVAGRPPESEWATGARDVRKHAGRGHMCAVRARAVRWWCALGALELGILHWAFSYWAPAWPTDRQGSERASERASENERAPIDGAIRPTQFICSPRPSREPSEFQRTGGGGGGWGSRLAFARCSWPRFAICSLGPTRCRAARETIAHLAHRSNGQRKRKRANHQVGTSWKPTCCARPAGRPAGQSAGLCCSFRAGPPRPQRPFLSLFSALVSLAPMPAGSGPPSAAAAAQSSPLAARSSQRPPACGRIKRVVRFRRWPRSGSPFG